MRSRVTPNRFPTSSSVGWCPSIRPNLSCSTRRSRGVSVSSTSSTSECSIVRDAASDGDTASLSSTKSPRWESSSSPIGVSSETGSCETFTISRTFSGVMPISSPISSSLGSRPSSWSRRRETRTRLVIGATTLPRRWRADQLGDRLDHVHRDADRPRLVGDGARDGLPDPPRGVGRELVALVVVELLDRPDQAHVAFLDEVEEGHAAADVLLGDRHDQPEVGLGQPLLGLVSVLVALGQTVASDAVSLH